MRQAIAFSMIFIQIMAMKQKTQKSETVLVFSRENIDASKFEFLNPQSVENQELKEFFEQNGVLQIPGLKSLVLDYVGPEKVAFNQLQTPELTYQDRRNRSMRAYLPASSMHFSYDSSQRPWLTVNLRKNKDVPHEGALMWHAYTQTCIAQGQYADVCAYEFVADENSDKLNQELTAKTHDEIFHASLKQLNNDTSIGRHKVTLSIDKTALLRAILNGKPELRALSNPKPPLDDKCAEKSKDKKSVRKE
jgi:hypothetical protein